MKFTSKEIGARAFTLIELMVIIFTLAMLVVLVVSGLIRAKAYSSQKACLNNMKIIGISFRVWCGDSRDIFQMRIGTNDGGTKEFIETGQIFRHFQVMSNELQTPQVVICPTDTRQPSPEFTKMNSNTNISYFVGVDADESNPQSLLSGDRNITNGFATVNGMLVILTNQTVGWSHGMHKRGGSLLVADGHAEFISTLKLRDAVQNSGTPTNRLAIP